MKCRNFWDYLSRIGLGKESNHFLENFSNLLVAGMPLADALVFVSEEIGNKTLRKIVQKMSDDIQSWFDLSEAMGNSNLFSPYVVSLVKIWQESGRLTDNISIIVDEQKKSQEMKSKVRSALMYPCFVLVLVVFVGTWVAWFILPKLASLFNGLNLELPTITKVLIASGKFLENHGALAVPSFLGLLTILFYWVFFYKKTKIIGEVFLFHCIGLKNIMVESELAKFWFLLWTLLKAGLSPLDSLNSLINASSTSRYRKFYEFLYKNMGDWFTFKQCFKLYVWSKKLIPSSIQQVIVSGEQSGVLSDTLVKLGESYAKKIEQTTKDLSVMLEPIMLIVVWIGVVWLALAVIMPIYGLIGWLK